MIAVQMWLNIMSLSDIYDSNNDGLLIYIAAQIVNGEFYVVKIYGRWFKNYFYWKSILKKELVLISKYMFPSLDDIFKI